MKKIQRKNYTLVEILTVISVIAILAGLTVGVSSLVMKKSRDTKTTAAIKYVEMALEKFKNENGYYRPLAGGGGVIYFPKDPSDKFSKLFDEKFRSGNTKEFPGDADSLYIVDGYGNPMFYRYPGYFNKGKYDLGSFGQDKKVGDNHGNEILESMIDKSADVKKRGGLTVTDYTTNFGKGDDIVNFPVNYQE